MKRFIILLLVLPLFFACDSNTKGTDNTDTVVTEETDKPVDVVTDGQGKLKMTINKDAKPEENTSDNNIPEGTEAIPGLKSASGEEGAVRETIDNEDEALNVKRAHTQFNNGITYYKEKNLTEAIKAFKTSLEYKSDNDKAFYNLGKIYYELGQKDLALSYYKDAVEINPNDTVSMLGVGLIYYEKTNYPEALKYYNQVLDIAPKFSIAYFNRGTMLGQNKQYDQSLEDLTNSIKYDPSNSEAFINRGLAHFYMKNLDLACEDWKKAEAMGNPKGKDAVKIYCSGDK